MLQPFVQYAELLGSPIGQRAVAHLTMSADVNTRHCVTG